ncbi:hypothetical protein F5Y02DRAFT_424050 [Annulohypoxylon stygium]|nr:hypothetical protein F5Y02DRAFT_424050 [Annulohypoxylon stygium]
MAGICNCRRPVIQNIVGNLWICTECATKVPDDEELEDPQTQNGNSRRIVGRSSLDLSWPKSVKYIDDDFPTRAVIEELKEIESILPSNKKQNLSFIRVKDERDGNNHSRTEAVRDEYYQYEPLNPAQSKDAKSDQWIRILRLSRGNEKICTLWYDIQYEHRRIGRKLRLNSGTSLYWYRRLLSFSGPLIRRSVALKSW